MGYGSDISTGRWSLFLGGPHCICGSKFIGCNILCSMLFSDLFCTICFLSGNFMRTFISTYPANKNKQGNRIVLDNPYKITTGFFSENTIVVAEGEMLVEGIFKVTIAYAVIFHQQK